jgi:NAD(P)-dependent dehydrogenase (short-subunit alcohol dehydrogenase family)
VGGLDGRRVVVTGAAGALGAAVVAACADDGAIVTGVDRHHSDRAGADHQVVNVLDDEALGAWFDARPEPWAVLNVIGGFAGARPIAELDAAELDDQLRLNLVSAALITKHALRAMSRRGEGRIVHTASRAATALDGVGFAYSVSKLGVLHLVTMAALETRGTAITVNAVVPSIMDTPANRAAMPGASHDRWPKVDEVAAVFAFLASPAATLISGAAVPVYGRT